MPPLIVTRPQQEAVQWAARLREAGVDAVAWPLIDIGPGPQPDRVRHAWQELARYAAVMFVSGNAVRGFFGSRPEGAAFAARAWSPGPGTREALIEAGVLPDRIDAPGADAAQYDSESLWAKVKDQLQGGDRLLLVRGGEGEKGSGRDWLTQQLLARGVEVDAVSAYVRRAPAWPPERLQEAAAALGDGSVWLLSSSEAIIHLRALLPEGSLTSARAIATHPRIAQAARRAGFGRVQEAAPRFDAVVAALESFQ